MTKVTIYDPAMCCSTGICGAEVDQNLVNMAADLDWLKSKGVEVTRINLSQEPTLFAENEQVKVVLESSGVEGLPVIIIDDKMRSFGRYPPRGELAEMVGIIAATSSTALPESTSCCGDDCDEQATPGCC